MFAVDLPIRPEWRQAMASGNMERLPTFEQLGARYGDILRAHAGSSPCVLAGYSFFGRVTFEAARAFMDAGGNVACVLLIDAYAMVRFYGGWRNFAKGAAHAIGGMHNPVAALLTCGRLLRWLVSRQALYFSSSGGSRVLLTHPRPRSAVGELHPKGPVADIHDEWIDDEQSLTNLRPFFTEDSHTRALKRLDAKGVLIRTGISGEESLPGHQLTNGWGELFAQGLEVIKTPGSHVSMVRDPANRKEVARAIESMLERYSMANAP